MEVEWKYKFTDQRKTVKAPTAKKGCGPAGGSLAAASSRARRG